MTPTLDWQPSSADFWASGHSRIYRVNQGLYLAAADGRWLKATFHSWAQAADALELTLECQPTEPDDVPPALPQARNFVVPGCSVEIGSEEPQPIGQLLSLLFAITHATPEAEVNFSIQVSAPPE